MSRFGAVVFLSTLGVASAAPVLVSAGPCDIYASGGNACVAAHSTTRALFNAYSGRLYQVRRASDGSTLDIGTLSAGGYANGPAQDTFCSGATCTITMIYDQTSRHNDLAVAGAGTAGAADFPSVANALPMTAGGHLVYGVYIARGNGYRDNSTSGVAVGTAPEGMYMVASGTHMNNDCCFDYGNAETNSADNGNGHMDAVTIGISASAGTGPWVGADLENGIYGRGSVTFSSSFVTAMLKNNGTSTFATRAGNAQSGGLTTNYNGSLPTSGGYIPMKLEGAIILGIGGDNSNRAVGSFFEGAMVTGWPSDATENAVQANVVAAGYAGDSNGGAPGTLIGPGTKCVDIAGGDSGVAGAAVQLWDCQTFAADQHWAYNLGDNSLRTLGRCLDIVGNGTANGAKLQLWDCNGVGGQKWVPQTNGSLRNPQSGRCLDSPSGATANNTRLQIWDCNGTGAQRFPLRAGTAGTGVIFYQDINFGGGSSLPKAKGDYAAIPADVPNDWMSSLRVPAGWTVLAYPDANFGGAVCTYTANTAWAGNCNDNMSSFRIQ